MATPMHTPDHMLIIIKLPLVMALDHTDIRNKLWPKHVKANQTGRYQQQFGIVVGLASSLLVDKFTHLATPTRAKLNPYPQLRAHNLAPTHEYQWVTGEYSQKIINYTYIFSCKIQYHAKLSHI